VGIEERKLTKIIVDKIKRLRRRTAEGISRPESISQNQLAESIGTSRMVIANIESGRQQMTVLTLYQICRALGAELQDVLPSISDVTNAPSNSEPAERDLVVTWAGKYHSLPPEEKDVAEIIEAYIKQKLGEGS